MMEKTYAKMRSKLASIYWPDSVDSSIGSSGSAGSSSTNDGANANNGSRNYVDPWDLENYAYIRRHSVALPPPPLPEDIQQQPIYQTTRRRRAGSRYAGPSDNDLYDTNYQYAAAREPGYHAPGSVEEIYFGSSDLSATLRRAAAAAAAANKNSRYSSYRRPPLAEPVGPIYETRRELLLDEEEEEEEEDDRFAAVVRSSHYDTPLPLYAKLSDIEQAEALEQMRRREMTMTSTRHRGKGTAMRSRNYPRREECAIHHPQRRYDLLDAYPEDDYDTRSSLYSPPTHNIGLSTYGHLHIDYTSSWNSLHRKIASK